MHQYDQTMAKKHDNNWNKDSHNKYGYNCFRKRRENYQNKNYEMKKRWRVVVNDALISQPLRPEWLSKKNMNNWN